MFNVHWLPSDISFGLALSSLYLLFTLRWESTTWSWNWTLHVTAKTVKCT